MIPLELVGRIALVVGTLSGIGLLTIVRRDRLRKLDGQIRTRLVGLVPYVGLLAIILVINTVARGYGRRLSWLLDLNITGFIYSIEGTLVADIQMHATPGLTTAFSSVYVYGYVFLLVFPLAAYFALEDGGTLRRLLFAYGLNYGIGVVCYVLFIAYGPRNLMPDMVDSLMYANWPQAQLLTAEVNTNTNVFPSLHASLSTTVLLFAYRTRKVYPGWLVVSLPLALLVMFSTMYLGIHWGIDVVAGVVLGFFSVGLAVLWTDEEGKNERLERTAAGSVAFLGRTFDRVSRRFSDDPSP